MQTPSTASERSCPSGEWPRDELEDLLSRVTRPGRYVGGEFNLRLKPQARPRVVLSYPDVYEVGMANQAVQILYAAVNDETPGVAERAYCPWPDMGDLMRARDVRLWSLESQAPVAACDLWGITLPHELTFTNVLEMLDLAGVTLHAAARGEDEPIVLGGGPAVADPWPLAAFFDAFFVGEVEGRVAELVEALGARTRAERLDQLGRVPGVWLPPRSAADAAGPPARRQVFTEFARTMPVTRPLVPLLEAVHDRAVVELMRGCTRGCRFCQAGMWYRPVRERPVDLVVEAAARTLAATGCDEVSLVSLSSCDYSAIGEAVERVRALRPGLRVSLPSLRVDSAAVRLARFGAGQRGSATLAPEAGTQRLRERINKGVDEAQLMDAVEAVFSGGFTGLKLYFMLGLPGESDDDARAIAATATKAAELARRVSRGRARLSVAVSSFVPKPHTPFEREAFAGEVVLRRRQRLLHDALPRTVKAAFHDVSGSLVEASLARGGRGSDAFVEAAWRNGARFDGWRERFDLRAWSTAAASCGVTLGEPAMTDPATAPWREAVDPGVDAAFLDEERRRAEAGLHTEDCRRGECGACGVCGGGVEMEVVA
ncbi:MAG TPA: TIGR03960 family B12-binding radical SAM protein [Thermoleophilia bacterium]|nr:TIGR03960 family B12-binding radical SAM protein [Thermoleophilia bacterium]